MKTMRSWLVVPALMAAPGAVMAQDAAGSVDARAQAQAEAAVQTPQSRIEAAMQAAARANVPVALLASKVAEGAAKRVPPERIAGAVEARLSTLVRASETLERARIDSWTAGELAVTADALEAGVSESALIRISRGSTAERRVVAIAVLSDLVRLGAESESAFLRVSAALGTNAALANLQAEVASQLLLGGLTSTLEAGGLLQIR